MSTHQAMQMMNAVLHRVLDGVQREGTYLHRGLPVYDPATGTVLAPGVESYAVPVLLLRFRAADVDGVRVLTTDRRIHVEQALLPVTPANRDRVEVAGVTYQVLEVRQDAAGLVWSLHGRLEGET